MLLMEMDLKEVSFKSITIIVHDLCNKEIKMIPDYKEFVGGITLLIAQICFCQCRLLSVHTASPRSTALSSPTHLSLTPFQSTTQEK